MFFLRDAIWQFIGAVISVVAIVLTIVLYKKQSTRREIFWDIVEHTPLSSFNISNKLKSQIIFENEILDDIDLIVLKIWNGGNVAIPSTDYEHPIRVVFEKNTRILEARIVETKPASLRDKVSITSDKESITLNPLLLNSKDTIVLHMVLSQFEGEIRADGRILGVKEIRIPEKTLTTLIREEIVRDGKKVLLISALGGAIFAIISLFTNQQPQNSDLLSYIILFIVIFVMLSFVLILPSAFIIILIRVLISLVSELRREARSL